MDITDATDTAIVPAVAHPHERDLLHLQRWFDTLAGTPLRPANSSHQQPLPSDCAILRIVSLHPEGQHQQHLPVLAASCTSIPRERASLDSPPPPAVIAWSLAHVDLGAGAIMLFLDISNSDDQNDFPLNDAADITPHVIADMEEKLRKLLNMQHLAAVEVRHIRSPQESKPTGLWRIAKVAILILIQHFLVSANKTAKQDTVSVWEETLPAFNTVDEVWEFAVRSAGDEREANLAMEFRRAISNDQLLPAIPNEKSPKPDWSRDPLSAISEDNTASSPTISETMIDVFRQEYPLTLSKLQHCHRLGDGEMSDDHDDQDHTHTLSAELDRYISEAQTAESLLAQFQSLRSQHLLPPSSNNTKALGSQSEAAKAASPYRKKNSEEQFIGKMRKSEHGQEHKPDVPARCATMPTSGPLSSSLSSLEKVHSNIHAETLRIMRFRDDDDRQRREQKVDVKRER